MEALVSARRAVRQGKAKDAIDAIDTCRVKCRATLAKPRQGFYRRRMSDSNLQRETPSHPGNFVRIEIIDPLGLSVKQAAEALGITRQALSAFLNGQSDLSPEMAIRLDKAFGVPLETLMHMQNAFDIAKAKERARELHVTRYDPLAKEQAQPRRGKQD